eukprot:scaffold13634_cov67-Phaeocystis_antarctica.AAC.2
MSICIVSAITCVEPTPSDAPISRMSNSAVAREATSHRSTRVERCRWLISPTPTGLSCDCLLACDSSLCAIVSCSCSRVRAAVDDSGHGATQVVSWVVRWQRDVAAAGASAWDITRVARRERRARRLRELGGKSTDRQTTDKQFGRKTHSEQLGCCATPTTLQMQRLTSEEAPPKRLDAWASMVTHLPVHVLPLPRTPRDRALLDRDPRAASVTAMTAYIAAGCARCSSACDLRWQIKLGIGQGFLERLRTAARDRKTFVRVQPERLELGALAEARRHAAC